METIPIAIAIAPLSFSLLGIITLSTESSTKNKWILVYENDFKNFKNATWQNVYQLSNPVWWRLDFSTIN